MYCILNTRNQRQFSNRKPCSTVQKEKQSLNVRVLNKVLFQDLSEYVSRRRSYSNRQRKRYVQSGLRGRGYAASRVPVNRRPPAPPVHHFGHGPEGLVHRRRGTEQTRHPHAQVPNRTRHHHQLGRHGEVRSPYICTSTVRVRVGSS